MITAEQARAKTNNKENTFVKELLGKCELAIEKASANCKDGCSVRVDNILYYCRSNVLALVKADLVSRGFEVKEDSGFDQRDNYSWHNLDISW